MDWSPRFNKHTTYEQNPMRIKFWWILPIWIRVNLRIDPCANLIKITICRNKTHSMLIKHRFNHIGEFSRSESDSMLIKHSYITHHYLYKYSFIKTLPWGSRFGESPDLNHSQVRNWSMSNIIKITIMNQIQC